MLLIHTPIRQTVNDVREWSEQAAGVHWQHLFLNLLVFSVTEKSQPVLLYVYRVNNTSTWNFRLGFFSTAPPFRWKTLYFRPASCVSHVCKKRKEKKRKPPLQLCDKWHLVSDPPSGGGCVSTHRTWTQVLFFTPAAPSFLSFLYLMMNEWKSDWTKKTSS